MRAVLRATVGAGTFVVGTFLVLTQALAALGGEMPSGPSAAPVGLELFDDARASAMFNLSGMSPGRAASNCIAVSYRGPSGGTEVRLSGTSTGTGLDSHLQLTVEEGDGGRFNDCSGFRGRQVYRGSLAAFTSAHPDFRSGLAGFSPLTESETKAFRFSVVLGDEPAAQGRSALATFTWEARPSLPGPAGPDGPGDRRRPRVTLTPSASGSSRPARSAPEWLRDIALQASRRVAFPFLLLLVVAGFLMFQDRIDRRDPKLALAPVYPEPDVGFDHGTPAKARRS